MSARVLHVVLSLNPGGTERLVLELASRLNDEIPMMVCCLDEAGGWASQLESRGIEVVALGRRPGFRPALGPAIASIAGRHRATTIHAHHYSPFVYACLARLTRPSVQIVFTEHGRLSDAPPSAKRRLANRVLGRFPRAVYAVSENLKQHMVGEGFAPERVGVIYNGIDVGPLPTADARARVRRDLGTTNNEFVIGTIARLDPVKDLGTLLRAVALITPERPVVLAVVGDGSERARLEQLTAELGLTSTVRFLGQRDDAREWLAGCDIYVNSSISEGVSLTILEAMAAGLPVVATRVGGTPEVVDESCGCLIPSRDPAALADAILDLSRDPPRRARLGRAARQRVEETFTLERMVREYAEAYAGESGRRV